MEPALESLSQSVAELKCTMAENRASIAIVDSCRNLQQVGEEAEDPIKWRESDIRSMFRDWSMTNPAVLTAAGAMLSGGEHSVVDLAVAGWLCSPIISKTLLQQLQKVDSWLSTLPIHEACNNPTCRTFGGNSEQGLVSGKACLCGGCRMGHYCSRPCLRQH